MKYRKKPLVDAWQFDPKKEWHPMMKPWTDIQPRDMSFGFIDGIFGEQHVISGDWIVKDEDGYFVCSEEHFQKTYEVVE